MIKETIKKVLYDQAYRLSKSLLESYGEHQASFLSKHGVASIYGFRHWADMMYFISITDNILETKQFEHVFLHPKTIKTGTIGFINYWQEKIVRLNKALNINSLPSKMGDDFLIRTDRTSTYLANTYGFKSMSDVYMNLRYHFQKSNKCFSINEMKNKELVIVIDFIPSSISFINEILTNQGAFGQTLCVTPKEWFKYELDASTADMSAFNQRKKILHGWTVGRIIRLLDREIKDKFGNYLCYSDAKSLLEAIVPILIYDSQKSGIEIEINSICEITKLRNILIAEGDYFYPEPLRFLIREYLSDIGVNLSDHSSKISKSVQRKHDQAVMLVASATFSLSSIFSPNSFSISDALIILDAESYGKLEKHEVDLSSTKLCQDIIDEVSNFSTGSMLVIYDTSPTCSSEFGIGEIRDYCKEKQICFLLVTNKNGYKHGIKNTVEIAEDGEILDIKLINK